jgi:hypothetical protein
MRRINYSAKRNQIKLKMRNFGKFNVENDVIRDAYKVICDSDLKKIGDIGKFGKLAHSAILALQLF